MSAAHQPRPAAAAAQSPQRLKITFPVGEERVIVLDSDDGFETSGQFGPQFQYTCNRGSAVMWIDPHVREMLLVSGARRGDAVRMMKREYREGNRRRVAWDVQNLGPAEHAHEYLQPEPPPPAAVTAQLAPPPVAMPPRTQAAPPRAHQPAAAPVQLPARAASAATPHPAISAAAAASPMFAAMSEAVDVVADIERAVNARGLGWKFTAEDVRAIALTIYIQQSRGGKAA